MTHSPTKPADPVELVIHSFPAGGWTVRDHAGTIAAFSTLHELCLWLERQHPEEGEEDTRRLAERLPPAIPAADDENVTPLRRAGILPWGRGHG